MNLFHFHTTHPDLNWEKLRVGLVHGWSLSGGGMVSRSSVGKPDDQVDGYGYIEGDYQNGNIDIQTLFSDYDTEPDVFYFNFSGHSGKMMYSHSVDSGSGGWLLYPQTDIKVEASYVGYKIDGFIFTSGNGNKYKFGFGEVELSHSNNTGQIGDGDEYKHVTTWYLKESSSAVKKDTIHYTYDLEKYIYPYLSSSSETTYGANIPPPSGCQSGYTAEQDIETMYTVVESRRLSSITTSSNHLRIDYISNDVREDLDALTAGSSDKPKRLNKIEIKSSGDVTSDDYCKAFNFTYKYSDPSSTFSYEKRLFLTKIQESACTGIPHLSPIKPYEFTYYGQVLAALPSFPDRLEKEIDHWGYWNGENNDSFDKLIPHNGYLILPNGSPLFYKNGDPNLAANRETNAVYMKKGVLEEIKYPTGGTTTFTFDANTEYGIDRSLNETTIVSNRVSNCIQVNGWNHIDDAVEISSISMPYAKYDLILDLLNNIPEEDTCGCATNGRFEYTIIANPDYDDGTPPPESTLTGVIQLPGCSSFVYVHQPISDFHSDLTPDIPYEFEIYIDDGKGHVFFDVNIAQTINDEVGGLRIKELVADPGVGDPIKTDYIYNDGEGKSTGKILIEPSYGFMVTAERNPGEYLLLRRFSSSSLASSADINGYSFGYSEVQVKKDSIISTYNYQLSKHTINGFPIPPILPIYSNGHLEMERHYKDLTSTIIKQTDYTGYITPLTPYDTFDIGIRAINFNCGGGASWFLYGTYDVKRPASYRLSHVNTMQDSRSEHKIIEYNSNSEIIHPIKEILTDSAGLSFETSYKYAYDFPGTYDFLVDANIVSAPIETQLNNGTAGGVKIDYSTTLQPGLIIPNKLYRMDASSNWRLDKEVVDVDVNGYPLEVWNRIQALNMLYTWSSQPDKKGQLDQMSHGTRQTQFKYKNRMHVDTIINFDGLISTYTYDDLQRLESVSDRNGNRTISYAYGFGQPQSGDTYVKTTSSYSQVTGSSFTSDISWQYFDGLGRPIQVVRQAHSPDQYDVAFATAYDSVGRVYKSFEAWESPSESDGSYKPFITGTSHDHTLTVYENSILNRPVSVKPPDWHATSYSYSTNSTNEVYDYNLGEYHPNGSLIKNVTTDPNGNKAIEFVDLRGRNVASWSMSINGTTIAKTNMLYDDRNRITDILPPGKTLSDPGEIYSFTYDENDKVLDKKNPDKLSILYRYNDRDLVDSIKDGMHNWVVYNYDNYERELDSKYGNQWISKNYYDGSLPIELGKLTKEELYHATDQLNTQNFFYDQWGRLDSVQGDHHECDPSRSEPCYKNSKMYFDYADNVLKNVNYLAFNDNSAHQYSDSITYDHAGRMTDHYFTVNGEQEKIANHTYTEKDELKKKNLGWTGSSYLQTLDFEYLDNGFLSSINQPLTDPYLPYVSCITGPGGGSENFVAGDLFYMELGYDESIQPDLPFALRKNGDISQMVWQTAGRPRSGYGFNYDYLNRLTDANYESIKANDDLDEGQVDKYDAHITYKDKLGNISSLSRKGVVVDTTPCAPKVIIDELEYTYYDSSSRIKDILDDAEEYKEGYPGYDVSTADYDYDDNGNMTYDPSRGVRIVYNRLNLPDSLIFDDGKIIVNLYDEAGAKLAQSQYLAGGILAERRDYIANVELVNGQVQLVHHDEGRVIKQDAPSIYVLPDTIDNEKLYFYADKLYAPSVILGASDVRLESRDTLTLVQPFRIIDDTMVHFEAHIDTISPDTGWQWEYYIKDHLGNIRISFADLNNDGLITVALDSTNEVLEENHYYPFGSKFNGPWLKRKNRGLDNKYSFNSNEEIPFVKYMDFNARTYDPLIGRFLQIDPLADAAPDWNPYRFGFNNPINYLDPDGLFEDKDAAKKHAKEKNIKTGLFSRNKIKEQNDGSYAIENKRENSITQDFGGEIGVQTGVSVAANDVMSLRSEDGGLLDRMVSGSKIFAEHRDGTETEITPITGTAPGPGKAVKGYKHVKTIGKKYKVFEKVVKSKKLGGQARAVYTKVKNKAGKTVRFFKDSFKRDGRHYERANKYPRKSRSRKRN